MNTGFRVETEMSLPTRNAGLRPAFAWTAGTLILAVTALAADTPSQDLDRRFNDAIRPFLRTYCVTCHGGQKPAAQFDLGAYGSTASVANDFAHWTLLRNRVAANEMPPKVAPQPDPASRQKLIDWIDAVRKEEARKTAGDPGPVLARRLSNGEYNYTIRDLTGVDIRPTREFPVDPANPAGFDNSGESLAMSPALLTKYLQAARDVANHMVLKPDGIGFAPHIVLAETDRDKYAVGQIIDFYHRQNTEYSNYFLAAWQYKHRAALGKPAATLAAIAAQNKVSPKYLATIWRTLELTKEDIGPFAHLQAMWHALPAPRGNQPDAAREACAQMRDYVVQLRKKIEYRVTELSVNGINRTAQPFLMWRNRQYATHRMDYDRSALQVEGEWKPVVTSAMPKRQIPADNADEEPPAIAPRPQGPDPDLHVPAARRAAYEAAFARFSAVFPDTFYIQERGRYFPDNTRDKGRYLSAGFHNLMGYFRDDQPLYELLLDEIQKKQLDGYWQELDFLASANIRTYVQFYLFESREAARGPDGGAAIPDKEITSEARIMKVKESYLARARASKNDVAIKAVEDHFNSVNQGIRWVEQTRLAAEPVHLDALLKFAARAYRRPLTKAERDDLLAYYHTLREKDGLSHEDAMRDSAVSILMSPDFCYRIDLVEAAGSPAARTTAAVNALPLSDYAIASRLSYFLWSSMPDEALLARAAAGDLRRPEVLAAQARRMLKDERALGLATEFGGNWLDFRRFEEHNAVDRERFPSFTNELREAMFQEPIRYIADVFQNNRSVLDLLFGNYTFVNPILAKHYGMPEVAGGPDAWVRVDDARKYGRGGLLPMSAFLTKNAPGLRTSPVKRGYWVVRRVLGEVIPPPPAVVPELPRDEAKLDLPLREMLARHRQDASCAACHARFDGFGLAFEGYGPVGETRTKDLAGHNVDIHAPLPGGVEAEGLDGVINYIREHRQNDFIDNLCRKMMVYALGRSIILSDEPVIEATRNKMAANGYRFNTLIESIVTSSQFLTKRGPEFQARKGE
jgi:Protein of unknown function (DUF1592)/Protein of unknown function (DUF1588)/Protein of unknown function (DUF1587)/Protein of unknown function (DUF1585)/Protein of unknown function (DUF1595)